MKMLLKLLLKLLLILSLSPMTSLAKTVLIVLSGESSLTLKNGKDYPTGFYLNELIIPARELIKKNYKLVFATPKGAIPSLDSSSDDPKYFENESEYLEIKALLSGLNILNEKKSPIVSLNKIKEMGARAFAGVFIPGGHAPMVDLAFNKTLGAILKDFHKSGKPTALVCHGPVALLSTLDDPSSVILKKEEAANWIYKDYKMTVFSDEEEIFAEDKKLNGKVLFYPQSTLERVGARIFVQGMWKANVVADRELITGQNPASDRELVKAFIHAMEKR